MNRKTKTKAVTSSEVWRALKETDRQMRETDRQMKETDRRMQETDVKIKELTESVAQSLKETAKLIGDLKAQVSGVNDNIGFGAETFFQTAFGKSLTYNGIVYDKIHTNLEKTIKRHNCEFDIVLENPDSVAVIDAKHRVHKVQVAELAEKKARIFREFFPEYKDRKLYLGLAGLSVEKGVEAEARTYGVGIIKQDGDAVKALDIPLTAY